MAYVALYRKYRSRGFGEVLGQKHVTQTLQNAINSHKFSHAYLFCGPRGCGKTSTARLLAKALNCEKGPTGDPCDECSLCISVRDGSCQDVVEMDAASETGIDNVKETIIENAKYRPMEARYKVYIIDEVHDLSPKAFDALLKTLEEPPAHVIFVLATTEAHKVPATVRSRCQLHQFRRGSINDLVERLEFVAEKEGFKFEPQAMAALARMGDGSWRDALTLLEQVIAFGCETITLEAVNSALGWVEEGSIDSILDHLSAGDVKGVLTSIEIEMSRGIEPKTVLESLISRIRELIYAAHNVEESDWLDPHRRSALHEQSVRIGSDNLHLWWSKLSNTAGQLRLLGSPRLVLELALLEIIADSKTPPAKVQGEAVFEIATPTNDKPVFKKPPPEMSKAASSKNGRVEDVPDSESIFVDDGTLTPFKKAWQDTIKRFKDKSLHAGAEVLSSGELIAAKDKQFTVAFRTELAFSKIQKKESIKLVEQEFCAALGDKGWKIQSEYIPAEPGEEVPEADNSVVMSIPFEGEPLLETVMEIFDAKPLND